MKRQTKEKYDNLLKKYPNETIIKSYSHRTSDNGKKRIFLKGVCGFCGDDFECRSDNKNLLNNNPACKKCNQSTMPDFIEDDIRIYKTIGGEEYSNILGFPGYWINKKGEIIGRSGKKIYQRNISNKGYEKKIFKTKQKTKAFSIHRLVALAFIPNPENKTQVNHIDGNKLNNHVSNLEWVTNQENHNHKMKNGLNVNKKLEEHGCAKLSNEQALYIKKSKEKNSDLAKRFNVSPLTISNIKRGISWKGLEDYEKK